MNEAKPPFPAWQHGTPDHNAELAMLCTRLAERDETIRRLREKLRSIAANTCCGTCQEAALVARAILAETERGA